MSKNKIIILLLIVVIVIASVVIINNNKSKEENKNANTNTNQIETILVEKLEDGTKLNTSNKLSETKKVGNLEISNAQLTNKDGKTTFLADVKNVGNETVQMLELEITLIDENANEIKTLSGLLGTIKSGATTQLNASAQKDYTNVYDYIVKTK